MSAGQETAEEPKPITLAKHLHIGWAFECARKRAGLRRTEVADLVGCHKSWITRLENGDNSPAFDFVEKMCAVYGEHLEAIRCGLLPQRIKELRSEGKAQKIETRIRRLPGGQKQFELAEQGIRLPRDQILRLIREASGIQCLRELLYGK